MDDMRLNCYVLLRVLSGGRQLRRGTDSRKRAGRRSERSARAAQVAAAIRRLRRWSDERMRLCVEDEVVLSIMVDMTYGVLHWYLSAVQ